MYIVKGVLYSGVLMVGRIVVRQNSQSLVSSLQRISTLKRNTRIVHFQSTLVFKIGLKHADVHFLCGENAVLHENLCKVNHHGANIRVKGVRSHPLQGM